MSPFLHFPSPDDVQPSLPQTMREPGRAENLRQRVLVDKVDTAASAAMAALL